MRKALTAAATALLLAGCSNAATTSSNTATTTAPSASSPAAKTAVTAEQALTLLGKTIPSTQQTGIVTADNDPNKLLGRPGQYTSKVTFSDSRITADNTDGLKPGDVEYGGAIEVFATAADAKTRADYIQNIGKNMPMLLEYDYPHGPVLVRVSKFLTPDQAAAYDKAGATFG